MGRGDSDRLAPYGAHVLVRGGSPPEAGQRVDCRDCHGKWLRAEVLSTRRPGDGAVHVHFHRYAAKFDEWIGAAEVAERIEPFGQHTSMHARAGHLKSMVHSITMVQGDLSLSHAQ